MYIFHFHIPVKCNLLIFKPDAMNPLALAETVTHTYTIYNL